MKKRFCIVFAAALAGMALILIAFYHAYADRETSMRRWGQQMADLTGTADMSSRSLAAVNGESIDFEQFKAYKIGLSYAAGNFSDEEILNKLIERKLMLQDAEAHGITVSEEEVRAFNEESFALMEQDEAGKEAILDYIQGRGITLEEYKEMCLQNSEIALIGMKYRSFLENEYDKTAQTNALAAQSFEDYYAAHLQTVRKNADIVINEELLEG